MIGCHPVSMNLLQPELCVKLMLKARARRCERERGAERTSESDLKTAESVETLEQSEQ